MTEFSEEKAFHFLRIGKRPILRWVADRLGFAGRRSFDPRNSRRIEQRCYATTSVPHTVVSFSQFFDLQTPATHKLDGYHRRILFIFRSISRGRRAGRVLLPVSILADLCGNGLDTEKQKEKC